MTEKATTTRKPRAPLQITPTGVSLFPHLNVPDAYAPPGGVAKPKYSVKLHLDPGDPKVAAFLKSLDKQLDVYAAEALKEPKLAAAQKKGQVDIIRPYVDATDKEGNETGLVQINPKMNASYEDKKTKKLVELKPVLFDAKNNTLDRDRVQIWSGSKLRVAFFAEGYAMKSGMKTNIGLALKMVSVQVIELVTGGQSNGRSPFDTDDDGYEADTDGVAGSAAFADADGGDAPAPEGEEDF